MVRQLGMLHLVAGEPDTLHVRDDDSISTIDVWRVGGFVLPHQYDGKLSRQAPNDETIRIYDEPFTSFRSLFLGRHPRFCEHWHRWYTLSLTVFYFTNHNTNAVFHDGNNPNNKCLGNMMTGVSTKVRCILTVLGGPGSDCGAETPLIPTP